MTKTQLGEIKKSFVLELGKIKCLPVFFVLRALIYPLNKLISNNALGFRKRTGEFSQNDVFFKKGFCKECVQTNKTAAFFINL